MDWRYGAYTESTWYWELVLLAQKFLLTSLLIFVKLSICQKWHILV